jgi:hypothetical protein
MALELIKWEPTLRGTPFHKQTLATVATGFVLSFVYLVSFSGFLLWTAIEITDTTGGTLQMGTELV